MASVIRRGATSAVAARAFISSAVVQAERRAFCAEAAVSPKSRPTPLSGTEFSARSSNAVTPLAGPSVSLRQWRSTSCTAQEASRRPTSTVRAYSGSAKPPRPRKGDPFATDKMIQWSEGGSSRRRAMDRRSGDDSPSPRPRPRADGQRRGDRSNRDQPAESFDAEGSSEAQPKRRWNPQKKLTHATMAAVRELARQDPETWTKQALSKQFGVSYEAIGRILRSKFREKEAARTAPASAGRDLGKWSMGGPGEGMSIAERADPAAFVRKAYELKRSVNGKGGEDK